MSDGKIAALHRALVRKEISCAELTEKYIEAIGLSMLTDLVQKYSNRNVRIRINGKVFNQ